MHAASVRHSDSLHARFFRCEQQLAYRAFKHGADYCNEAASAGGPSGTRAKLQFGMMLMKAGDPVGYGTQHHEHEVSGTLSVESEIPESAISALTDDDVTRLGELRDMMESARQETRRIVEAAIARAGVSSD